MKEKKFTMAQMTESLFGPRRLTSLKRGRGWHQRSRDLRLAFEVREGCWMGRIRRCRQKCNLQSAYQISTESHDWNPSTYWHTRNTVEKGTVLCGYGNPEPVPIPEHTRDRISTVLPIPVSFPKYISSKIVVQFSPLAWTCQTSNAHRPNTRPPS